MLDKLARWLANSKKTSSYLSRVDTSEIKFQHLGLDLHSHILTAITVG